MAYTAPPVRWDHELIIGDTYQPLTAALQDGDDAAIDITGATGTMQIRTEPGGALLATGTVTITSAVDGEFQWSIAAATTAQLQPQRAQYSVRLTFADATVRTVLEGTVQIRRSVVG